MRVDSLAIPFPGWVMLALSCCLAATPAAADRHCFPAQDYYYFARQDASAAEMCETRRAHAVNNLRVAVQNAQICGCPALIAHLGVLLEATERAEECPDAISALLEAEASTKRIVSSCH